ncbi:hypothetical protein ACHAC9_12740 [Massilia sp. CMS3.1]|uniref:hypothetical protein n=1 Tax=Massilia sp. CMS3.1 TaxID=3373083 RepID=UPI003EE7CFF2
MSDASFSLMGGRNQAMAYGEAAVADAMARWPHRICLRTLCNNTRVYGTPELNSADWEDDRKEHRTSFKTVAKFLKESVFHVQGPVQS